MKKDLVFPEVKDVHIAIVKEWNEDFTSHDWIVYLINNTSTPLESAMVMSRGQHKDGRKTSTFRHAFKEVAAKTAIKVELIMEEVFAFKNEFVLTYFIGTTLYDHVYTAVPFSITPDAFVSLPVMHQDGVLLK